MWELTGEWGISAWALNTCNIRSETFRLYDNTLLVVQAASVANHLQDTAMEKVDRMTNTVGQSVQSMGKKSKLVAILTVSLKQHLPLSRLSFDYSPSYPWQMLPLSNVILTILLARCSVSAPTKRNWIGVQVFDMLAVGAAAGRHSWH